MFAGVAWVSRDSAGSRLRELVSTSMTCQTCQRLVKRDAVVVHLAVFHKSILLPFKISHGTFVLPHSFGELQLPQWPNCHWHVSGYASRQVEHKWFVIGVETNPRKRLFVESWHIRGTPASVNWSLGAPAGLVPFYLNYQFISWLISLHWAVHLWWFASFTWAMFFSHMILFCSLPRIVCEIWHFSFVVFVTTESVHLHLFNLQQWLHGTEVNKPFFLQVRSCKQCLSGPNIAAQIDIWLLYRSIYSYKHIGWRPNVSDHT